MHFHEPDSPTHLDGHFGHNGSNGYSNGIRNGTNGASGTNGHSSSFDSHAKTSNLRRSEDSQLHDVVAVGFGPASLAIAVALHDTLDTHEGRVAASIPKVRFLERQPRFAWHAGMLLADSKMQICFMKDMATLRNPQSRFTFFNYLHTKQRLASFANLGTLLPQRVEYEDYMRWCAGHFHEVVDYSTEVTRVEVDEADPTSGAIKSFRVVSVNVATGHETELRTRHVVIAVGGRPSIPKALQLKSNAIIHSSQYMTHEFETVPKKVAVIGGGQSAAEIFNDVPSRFPGARSVLLSRADALRPSDDSPFVNELFDSDRVDEFFLQDPDRRAAAISSNRATNYGVVRLELLDHIYSKLYSYRVRDLPEDAWPHRILKRRTVTGISEQELNGKSVMQLQIEDKSSLRQTRKETIEADLIVVATGYTRNFHEHLMRNIRHLMPSGEETWAVRRDYGIQFRNGTVVPDAGIWLQGCNEGTHGLPDSLLSILATRGGEIVDSIWGKSGLQNGKVEALV